LAVSICGTVQAELDVLAAWYGSIVPDSKKTTARADTDYDIRFSATVYGKFDLQPFYLL
jgi:hypothetical protein